MPESLPDRIEHAIAVAFERDSDGFYSEADAVLAVFRDHLQRWLDVYPTNTFTDSWDATATNRWLHYGHAECVNDDIASTVDAISARAVRSVLTVLLADLEVGGS